MQSSSPSETRLPVYQGMSRDQMYNGHWGDVCRVTATTCTYLIMWGRMWSRTHYINETWIKLIAFLPPTDPLRFVNEYRGLRYHRHAAAVLIMLVLSRESRMSADISRWYFTAYSVALVNRSSLHRVTITYFSHVINCSPSARLTRVHNYGVKYMY